MEQYTLKLTSGTSYRLYQGSTLVTDSDLTTLFSTAGSAYFNFDFNGGTPSATNTAVIVDSNGVTIVTITATILDSANYKGVWGDSATTFTSFDSLSGKSLDESQLSFLMGEIKESPVVGTDISTVIDTAFVSTANIQSDAVTTPKIADYNVTAEKLASESVTTAKIEDGAVTSDKIDLATVKTAVTQYIGGTDKGTTNALRVTKLSDDLYMAMFYGGHGDIIGTNTLQWRLVTSAPLFQTIYSYSASGRQGGQASSYLYYVEPLVTATLLDCYLHCANTSTASSIYMSCTIIGDLTDDMKAQLFGN